MEILDGGFVLLNETVRGILLQVVWDDDGNIWYDA